MTDLDTSYLNRRAFQTLENSGDGRDAAGRSEFAQSNIEEVDGNFSKVGRNPDDGVAMKIKDYSRVEVAAPGFMTSEDAAVKAEITGVTNLREDSGYFVADDESLGEVILGKVEQAIEEAGEAVSEAVSGVGKAAGEFETTVSAPITGLMRGIARFGGNVLGATGLVDQVQVDQFNAAMDQLTEIATKDQPVAQALGMGGEIAGQFIVPAVGTFNKLRALGASPVLASIISEAGVGALGMSPNEENLFNLIPEDSDTMGLMRDLMATDPDSSEWVNRAKNAGEALIALGGGEAAVRGVIKATENAKRMSMHPVAQTIKNLGLAGDPVSPEFAASRRQFVKALGAGTEAIAEAAPVTKVAEVPTKNFIDATPTEQKFFQEFLGNKANREELLESVPSFELSEGEILVDPEDIEKLQAWIDETVVLDGPGAVPPRLKKNDFYSKLEDSVEFGEEAIKARDLSAPVGAAAAIPLAAGEDEQPTDQEGEVQVASASSKFLKQLLGQVQPTTKAARAGKSILEGNYREFADDFQADLFGARAGESIQGVDFNLQNINTTEEVKQQMNTFSEAYSGVIAGKTKGVIPHEVTNDIATLLGQTPEQAAATVKSLPSDTKDLHVRALTMRRMLVESAEYTDELARVIRDGGPDISDGDYMRFREQIVRHAQLQGQMKGVQTEIARALSAFRIPAEAGRRNPQITGEMLDRMGGRGTAREIADRWLTTPIDRRAQFAERSMFAKTRSAAFEIWINGLLSGLRTHQVNTFGNLAFTAFQIPERIGAAAIGAITRSPDRVRWAEITSMLYGGAEGAVDGVRLSWKAWRTEMPADGISKIEAQQIRSISPEAFDVDPNSIAGKAIDYIGQGVRLPGRALMAEDEFFKSTSYRMQLRALTTRNILNARDAGDLSELILETSRVVPAGAMDDAAALTRLREAADTRNLNAEELGELKDLMLANPIINVDSAAHDFATMTTFQTELGKSGQALQSFVGSVPGARIILPFIRTPTNIIKEFGRRNPLLAPLMPSVGADIAAGGARRDTALAKIGLGTGLMSYAMLQAMEGNITGGGPEHGTGLYAQWRETHQPYSVKLGDQWVPYGRIEPLALLFGSVADAVDFIQYSDDDDANEKVYLAAFVGVMKNIGDKTFLRGMAEFADAYSDPNRYAEGYVARLARTAIPFSSMVRDITRATDPVLRETRVDPGGDSPINAGLQRVINEFKSALPGYSKDLPAKRTFWGEERRAYDGGPGVAFFAFSTRKIKKSPIDNELVRLGQPLRMPSRRVGGHELSWDQNDRLITLMNQTPAELGSIDLITKYGAKDMREAMNNLVQSDLWEAIEADEVKAEFLTTVRNDYIDAAKEALSREDPIIAEARAQEEANKLMLEGQRSVVKQLGPLSTQVEPPTIGQ